MCPDHSTSNTPHSYSFLLHAVINFFSMLQLFFPCSSHLTSARSSASFLSILVRAPSSSSRSSDMRPSSSWCISFSRFSYMGGGAQKLLLLIKHCRTTEIYQHYSIRHSPSYSCATTAENKCWSKGARSHIHILLSTL